MQTLREYYENGDFVTVSPTYDKSNIFHFRLFKMALICATNESKCFSMPMGHFY